MFTPELIGIFLYLALQLAFGLMVSKNIKTQDDYLLAGLVSWILFAYIHEIPTPYLVSIASALAGYIGGAFFDSWKKWPARQEYCETLAA